MDFSTVMDDRHLSYSTKRINKQDVPNIEKYLGVHVGKQLEEYILNYGFIAFGFIEFFGIKKKQMKNSDMIMKTQWLHRNFDKTKDLIAFEDQGDGDYYLVDSKDGVFRFVAANDELIDLNINLSDYIIRRFNQAAERMRY